MDSRFLLTETWIPDYLSGIPDLKVQDTVLHKQNFPPYIGRPKNKKIKK